VVLHYRLLALFNLSELDWLEGWSVWLKLVFLIRKMVGWADLAQAMGMVGGWLEWDRSQQGDDGWWLAGG